jgi:hypothetical protein
VPVSAKAVSKSRVLAGDKRAIMGDALAVARAAVKANAKPLIKRHSNGVQRGVSKAVGTPSPRVYARHGFVTIHRAQPRRAEQEKPDELHD